MVTGQYAIQIHLLTCALTLSSVQSVNTLDVDPLPLALLMHCFFHILSCRLECVSSLAPGVNAT